MDMKTVYYEENVIHLSDVSSGVVPCRQMLESVYRVYLMKRDLPTNNYTDAFSFEDNSGCRHSNDKLTQDECLRKFTSDSRPNCFKHVPQGNRCE
ncbi:hypothetical protein CEXT_581571 [Caerostris extrusa]|uniref:Uncharacterized protein n=1 Tax=Caerostris extrusa TaxID=172846 RepID=A0AAV4MXI2_CAEEX|nr:hypothetical protein CEXT_581571 [Caerostris extrusa]